MPPPQNGFSLANSPYLFDDSLPLELSQTTIIEPGVHVAFAEGGSVAFDPVQNRQTIGDLSGPPITFGAAREEAEIDGFPLEVPGDEPVTWLGSRVALTATQDLDLLNVAIHDAETGLFSDNNDVSITLDGCEFAGCADYGVHLEYNEPAIIQNCSIEGNGVGLYLYHTPFSLLDDNSIVASTTDGLCLHYSGYCRLDGNTIFSNGRDGVSLIRSDLFKFRYNLIESNGRNGVSQVSSDVTYLENRVRYNEDLGLEVHTGLADLHNNVGSSLFHVGN